MEWQPIATAPKTGGRMMLGRETGPEILLCDEDGSIYIGFWNGRSWDDGDFHDDLGDMEYWLPLPKIPR